MTLLKKASIVIFIAIIAVLAYLVFAVADVEEEIYKEGKETPTEVTAASEAK